MFEEKYRSLFEKIDGNEEHKEKVRKLMQKERTMMENGSGKNSRYDRRTARYVAASAVLLVTSFALFKMLGTGDAKSPIAEGETPPAVVEKPEDTAVLYSSLDFAEISEVNVPEETDGMTGKIAAFTEDILSEGSAVIKATVTAVRFKEYQYVIKAGEGEEDDLKDTRQSVIYEVMVDKLYHSDGSITEGETLVIENDLYTYTSLASSVEKLSSGRQYILALHENEGEVYIPQEGEEVEGSTARESRLSVLYPFTSQIEITNDGQYLFPDHWVSLVNEKAKTVTMDVEGFGYYGEMKLRDDEDFESDFQSIVDTYLGK
ncbi:hypothetical protein [Proteiniclasticum sp.]|uniref:hypothetical protein n=1 Tax=Proteiniclasticum sp. TaxID=2053595 RepID=UPI00289F7B50|nr:hypothetical protein [Proteiniclasticum sp.]